MTKWNRKQRNGSRDSERPQHRSGSRTYLCEADVAEGIESIARQEVLRRFGDRVTFVQDYAARDRPGSVQFRYNDDLQSALRLRTVQAVYLLQRFSVPRPRALLGDENFRTLLQGASDVLDMSAKGSYKTFRLDAAGSGSAVMMQIKQELAQHTGLTPVADEGDLLVRIRPSVNGKGWDVLIRLSPRPLATRDWRICNLEGALNATIAYAMIMLTDPKPEDVFLNVACGSGTFLIERAAFEASRRVIGCDVDQKALECARPNIEASGFQRKIELYAWDARSLPLADESVDAQCTDLPYGHLVGTHVENVDLYPQILHEAARVAKYESPLVVITHEAMLTESTVRQQKDWDVENVLPVAQRGLHSRIFVLRRR